MVSESLFGFLFFEVSDYHKVCFLYMVCNIINWFLMFAVFEFWRATKVKWGKTETRAVEQTKGSKVSRPVDLSLEIILSTRALKKMTKKTAIKSQCFMIARWLVSRHSNGIYIRIYSYIRYVIKQHICGEVEMCATSFDWIVSLTCL